MSNFHNLKVRDEIMESVLLMNKSSREVSCCVVDDKEIEIEIECEEIEYEEIEYEEIEYEEIEFEYEEIEVEYECESCGKICENVDELCCF